MCLAIAYVSLFITDTTTLSTVTDDITGLQTGNDNILTYTFILQMITFFT